MNSLVFAPGVERDPDRVAEFDITHICPGLYIFGPSDYERHPHISNRLRYSMEYAVHATERLRASTMIVRLHNSWDGRHRPGFPKLKG
jgi:hypothetical protein